MNTKLKLSVAVLTASLLLPTAHAADQGGVSIPMISIPGRNLEMGKTEVTQAQWQAVMGENPSYFSKCGDDCPVESVSWDDVQAFIGKLNFQTGKNYRLPSKAEWDYACLAGSNTVYCGGYDVDKVAWTKVNSGGETSSVADKRPNAWGLYDMSGNVWEWVEDKYDDTHDWRELRGGSWFNEPLNARASYHYYHDDPAKRSLNIGFRLARTLP